MRSILILVAVLVLTCSFADAFYAKSSGVVALNSQNFKKQVIDSDELWLVEFYAPWCGHCKSLKPVWEKVAKALKGIVKVGAVDMDADPQAGAPYDVKGFPTLKFFGTNKSKPDDYQGGRDENGIIKYVMKQIKTAVNGRLKGKQQESKSSSSSNNKGGRASSEGDVVVLTDSNFDETVYNSKDVWLIEFYAPWCGHCKKLEPEWNEAASAMKGKVKFGKVDATEQKKLGSRFQIQGYPTIKYWEYGKGKSDRSAKAYESGRTASDIQNFAAQLLSSADIQPEVTEITNHEVFNNECTSGVCLVAFLPNIYESNAETRKEYIQRLKETAKSTLGKPFVFFWAQAGDNIDLENNLGLGFGFPAIIAISPQKNKFGVMKGAFNEKGVKSFVDGLLIGKTPLGPLPANFKFKKVSAWDGKDAPPLEEENYDFEENADL